MPGSLTEQEVFGGVDELLARLDFADIESQVDSVFDAGECDICDAPANAIGTLQPCGHKFIVCREHRRQMTTHIAWRAEAKRPLPCAVTGDPVLAVTWERYK